jgi:hypothetical protein
MPKRISKAKKKKASQEDVNQVASRLVRESTSEPTPEAQISQLMAEMGRRGGKIGGKRRLETMTAEQRSQSALRAAQARWKKKT